MVWLFGLLLAVVSPGLAQQSTNRNEVVKKRGQTDAEVLSQFDPNDYAVGEQIRISTERTTPAEPRQTRQRSGSSTRTKSSRRSARKRSVRVKKKRHRPRRARRKLKRGHCFSF